MISALILAGVLDPNCIPRHALHTRAFAYHAHYYHPPSQPACREPWPDPNLEELHVSELPHSVVAGDPPDLGRIPAVIWPGYVPNPPPPKPAHQPEEGPGTRPAVSVPEPSTPALFALGLAALAALGRRRRSTRP